MEIKYLKSIICIAEQGSLSGAARSMNVTQPALSALLRRMEEELEVVLVVRHSRGVSLTNEGNYLLERAYSILSDVSDAKSTLRELSEEPTGDVHLGLPTTVAGALIPLLLPKVRARYPHIRLHIVEAMSGLLVDFLQMGKLDLGVLYDVQPMPGLRSEPILNEDIRLIVRHDNQLAQFSALSLSDLTGHGLVLPSSAHSIRQLVDRSASMEGIKLNVEADVDSLSGLIGLVNEGYATMLTTYLLDAQIRSGEFRAIKISHPRMEWTVHLATKVDILRPRAAMAVGRLLIELCLEQVQCGAWNGRVHPRYPVVLPP